MFMFHGCCLVKTLCGGVGWVCHSNNDLVEERCSVFAPALLISRWMSVDLEIASFQWSLFGGAFTGDTFFQLNLASGQVYFKHFFPARCDGRIMILEFPCFFFFLVLAF